MLIGEFHKKWFQICRGFHFLHIACLVEFEEFECAMLLAYYKYQEGRYCGESRVDRRYHRTTKIYRLIFSTSATGSRSHIGEGTQTLKPNLHSTIAGNASYR
jgi:hypothetical protein